MSISSAQATILFGPGGTQALVGTPSATYGAAPLRTTLPTVPVGDNPYQSGLQQTTSNTAQTLAANLGTPEATVPLGLGYAPIPTPLTVPGESQSSIAANQLQSNAATILFGFGIGTYVNGIA